jgi:conjugal transfer pilus assembly protein TraE
MNLSTFKERWLDAARDSAAKHLLVAALLATNMLTAVALFRVEETVVLVPAIVDERMSLQSSNASASYKKAWGLTVAQLCGNVTPGNADLVMQSLGDLMSPSAYRKIAADLAAQIGDIKRDSLTVRFEPQQILYDSETNTVFVSGQFSSAGVSGQPIKAVRTYEMTIEVRFGRPWITSFKPYSGMPAGQEQARRDASLAEARA